MSLVSLSPRVCQSTSPLWLCSECFALERMSNRVFGGPFGDPQDGGSRGLAKLGPHF